MRAKEGGHELEFFRDGYCIYLDKKAKRNKDKEWIGHDQKCTWEEWHRIAPLECRLAPGQGPIRIELRRVK